MCEYAEMSDIEYAKMRFREYEDEYNKMVSECYQDYTPDIEREESAS